MVPLLDEPRILFTTADLTTGWRSACETSQKAGLLMSEAGIRSIGRDGAGGLGCSWTLRLGLLGAGSGTRLLYKHGSCTPVGMHEA